ncbi:hypothetical protein TSAR_008016 [Trichomalopsis sarcophagae]|uniref:Uncharacterized protein n=1 Tax=Trichomalopsis sarcophagae TaxID=543379 RepID=A0A232FNH4_9HYME|nr:hypothetical protein TSAR_008016 [Trichomalopsis sarcophagae]
MSAISMYAKDADIKGLWSLDVLGIKDPIEHKTQAQHNSQVIKAFREIAHRIDPLGFVFSVSLSAKILLQEGWAAKISGNEEVNENIKRRFLNCWHRIGGKGRNSLNRNQQAGLIMHYALMKKKFLRISIGNNSEKIDYSWIGRFSEYSKLIRVLARVKRFLINCKTEKKA